MEEKIYHDSGFDGKSQALKVRLDDRSYVEFRVVLPGDYDFGEVEAKGVRISCPFGEVIVNGVTLRAQPTQNTHLVKSGEILKISTKTLSVLTCLYRQY